MRRHARILTTLIATITIVVSADAQQSDRRMNVAFVVWDDVELIELMGPAQIISSAAGFDEFTVGEAIKPMHSRFITIVPDFTFENCPKPDIIVIPGGRGGLSASSEQRIVDWLRKVEPHAEAILAVCNGVVILAHSGLLDDHEATAPDGHLDEVMILGRSVTPIPHARYHESGKSVTSQSYFAAVDAALSIVKRIRGDAEARRVADGNHVVWQIAEAQISSGEEQPSFATGRYLVFKTLMEQGVEAAVQRFHRLANGEELAEGPPTPMSIPQERHFEWLIGSISGAGRHAEAAKLGQFMVTAFPGSVTAQTCLAEAIASAGNSSQAARELLTAAENGVDIPRVRAAAASLLHRLDCIPSDQTRRIRRYLEEHPFASRAELATPDEPGVPLVVNGTVEDQNGHPIGDALLYVFHADASGRYTRDKTMDEPNARLFAYIQTGADGRFEFRTIRPGGYAAPDDRPGVEWQIPAHIHFQVTANGHEARRFQLVFEDDPRMQPDHWRRWAREGGNPIASVETDVYRTAHCVCDVRLTTASN